MNVDICEHQSLKKVKLDSDLRFYVCVDCGVVLAHEPQCMCFYCDTASPVLDVLNGVRDPGGNQPQV